MKFLAGNATFTNFSNQLLTQLTSFEIFRIILLYKQSGAISLSISIQPQTFKMSDFVRIQCHDYLLPLPTTDLIDVQFSRTVINQLNE